MAARRVTTDVLMRSSCTDVAARLMPSSALNTVRGYCSSPIYKT
jgi:hypothetical protein